MATLTTDLNITAKDVGGLASADAVAGFLTRLGYNTDARTALTAESIGLSGDSAAAIQSIELLSEDSEGFLRVVLVQLRSLTAKSRNDLARVLGKANVDHLLVLTSDFNTLEFVLLHKRRRETRGPGGVIRVQVVPLAFAVARKAPATKELRTIRRFTWTCRDGLEQFDKARPPRSSMPGTAGSMDRISISTRTRPKRIPAPASLALWNRESPIGSS